MNLADALGEGLQVTVLGLSIVFSVLVILMIVLYLFKVIFYKDPKKQMTSMEKALGKAVEELPLNEAKLIGMKHVPGGVEATYTTDKNHNEPYGPDDIPEEELVAILTAAVAASLNTSTYNLRIKSYKRVGGLSSAWNRAGVNETINNRF